MTLYPEMRPVEGGSVSGGTPTRPVPESTTTPAPPPGIDIPGYTPTPGYSPPPAPPPPPPAPPPGTDIPGYTPSPPRPVQPTPQRPVNRPPATTRPQPTSIPDDILDYERRQEERLGIKTRNKATDRIFDAGEMGLSADTMLPDYVVTEESLGNIGELRGETGPLRLPSNLIEMEAYLAARLNPLLHEVLIFTQHEGIPPALQGNVEKTLKLFGENDIDVGDRKEAEAYLTYLMNRDFHDYRRPHRLNTSWEEAHEVYDQNVEDIDSHPTVEKYRSLIQTTYGVSLTRAEGEGNAPWDLLRVRMVQVGLEMAATAVGDMARRNGLDWDDITAFRRIIGDIELRLTSQPHDKGALAEVYGPIITFYSNGYPFPNLLLHELGHVFNANVGLGDRDHLSSINYTKGHPDTWTGLGGSDPDGLGLYEALGLTEGDKLVSDVEDMVLRLQQSWDPETNEYTADGFLNWVFYRNSLGVLGFTDTDKGKEWQAFMHDNMYAWLRNAIVLNALRDNSNIPFYLEHDKILGYVGLATVRNDNEVIVRTEHSTAGGNSTVAGTLTRGDEVAVIGQAVGEIHFNPRGSWTAIIWNGRKRWVASELLNLPQSTAPTVGVDDPFFTFDASHFSASGWQFFFDLVQYLDKGVGNAN